MTSLLEMAAAQLALGDGHANRRAAWFARAALEDAVVALLRGKQVDVGPMASGRAKLTCLESLYREDNPQLATSADYAWSRLSGACHQHAFELTPTYVEIAHLIDLVKPIADKTRAKQPG